jgi:hypothetical protein
MKKPHVRPELWGAVVLAAASAALLAWGCAGPRDGRGLAEPAPEIPSFLSGPAGLLLTNSPGFSAHLVMETSVSSNRPAALAGDLLGRGGKLLFAPGGAAKRKGKRGGGFLFVWDVAARSGWILSESLQGFAPVSSSDRYAIVTVNTALDNGLPKKPGADEPGAEEVDVASGDGSVTACRVWPAPEANGFPRRIAAGTPAASFAIQFSNIKLEAPAAGIFQPPDGFTRYDTPDAMMLELLARGQGGKRGGNGATLDDDASGGRRGGRSATGTGY